MKYVLNYFFCLIVAVFYYPILIVGVLGSIVVFLLELIWHLKLEKKKDGDYNSYGLMMIIAVIEDALPFKEYKKTLIKMSK